MRLDEGYLRIRKYFRKHGLRKSVWRCFALLKQRLSFRRQVVLWMDLSAWRPERQSNDSMYSVVRIQDRKQLPEAFHALLGQEHAEELIERQLGRRFSKCATLWCLRREAEFFGYTWTIPSTTLRPYFFPLTPRDVHLFDNFIFPAYRGRRLNTLLVTEVLAALKRAGFQRVYAETGEWNDAELRSLDRVGFLRLGYATRRSRRTKNVVTWSGSESAPTARSAVRLPNQGAGARS